MTYRKSGGDPMRGFAEREARQFRRIFAVSVVVFLAVGAIARVLPRSIRPWTSVRAAGSSLLAEAKSAANRFIPFAFGG
jgi:hypothetical protein